MAKTKNTRKAFDDAFLKGCVRSAIKTVKDNVGINPDSKLKKHIEIACNCTLKEVRKGKNINNATDYCAKKMVKSMKKGGYRTRRNKTRRSRISRRS